MRNRGRRKFRQIRNEFKKDLYLAMKENKALPMLVLETYTAWQHRKHIGKIWAMFRNPDYVAFQEDYMKNLMGKHICGTDEMFRSLYFGEKELYDKYHRLIPGMAALGDALSVAFAVLKEREKENKAS